MRGKCVCSLAAIGVVLFSNLVYAEDGAKSLSGPGLPENNVSTSLGSSVLRESPLDRVYLNYFGIFHGAPLSNLGSSRTVDNNGNPSRSGIYLDSEITAAYMINSDIGIGPSIPFLLVPVLGQGIILGDLGIKAFDKKTLSFKGFTLYTNLIIQAPTSQASQARDMTLGLKTTPYFLYHFPGSRFTVGAWTEAKAYLGVNVDKEFKLYGAPYINYRVAPNLALNLEYEVEAHHNVGTSSLDFTLYQTDLMPGVIWNVTPKILVNPYFQIFTGNKISMDTTALGAVISATVL